MVCRRLDSEAGWFSPRTVTTGHGQSRSGWLKGSYGQTYRGRPPALLTNAVRQVVRADSARLLQLDASTVYGDRIRRRRSSADSAPASSSYFYANLSKISIQHLLPPFAGHCVEQYDIEVYAQRVVERLSDSTRATAAFVPGNRRLGRRGPQSADTRSEPHGCIRRTA